MSLISDSESLKKHADELRSEAFITVDTEFLREKTYYPLLCLVQIGGSNNAFAVDVLAEGIDLTPMWELIYDPKIVKVLHSASQDLEIFYNHNQKLPPNIFDTQIAAGVLGYGEAIGYGNLADKMLNINLDKSTRHTDWSSRPLTQKQIEYALGDVTHLYHIYQKLIAELESKGRTSWADEEIAKTISVDNYVVHPDDAWKKVKIRGGSSQFLSIVQALAKWREQKAVKYDKPRQWIMKTDGILEIASVAPTTIDELKKMRHVTSKNDDKLKEILRVVKEAAENKNPPVMKKKKMIPKSAAPIMDILRLLLKIKASEHDISPSIVAKSDDIEQIVINDISAKNVCDFDIPALHGWRYEAFGKAALEIKAGKLALRIKGTKIEFFEV